ncbi:MAG TPA: glycoside hydrolase family 47 protein, partial [Thermoanaerobaculia bacterium]|nr:glycoside hydrolase family 47 protein [Thermoanaerobaculia bacterium]
VKPVRGMWHAGRLVKIMMSRQSARFLIVAGVVLFVLTACASGRAPSPMAERVRDEFLHSWRAYERFAWGHDELRPVSRTARDWYGESLLITPVDALGTMILMGLDAEAEKTRKLIIERLSFDKDIEVKNFEIVIRILGGLLSAYEMTGDRELLRLADDLGTRLLPVFDSPTGMPYMYVNLRTGKTRGARTNPAEIGTLIVELGTLSRHTNRPVYFEKAKHALVQLYERRSPIGLVGEEIDVETGLWLNPASHVGGAIDSYYEYLLKCAILFDDADCRAMYEQSVAALHRHLADETPSGLWYGQADMATGRRTATQFGALHAFLPGVFALAADLPRAQRLQESSYKMWTLHGIEPEVLDYSAMSVVHAGYPLRPEIIESAYVLHHFTRDRRWREMGQTFFQSLIQHCRTDSGYTVLKNVVTKEKGDLMPSYFLAETLKYLYLMYAPEETLDFEKVVFNTEAHPLRR